MVIPVVYFPVTDYTLYMKNVTGLALGHGWNKGLPAEWSSGEKNGNWKGGKLTKKCEECGVEMFVWPYLKDKKKYCGKKCSLKHTSVKGGWNKGTKTLKTIKETLGVDGRIINKYWLGKKRPNISKMQTGKKRPNMQNEKNHLWKGDSVSYRALHRWVRGKLGAPICCSFCGKTEGRIEWASVSHKAKRDVNDYISLCIPCHRDYDKRRRV